MENDRERWNARWRERAADLQDASGFLREHAEVLGRRGKALDLAGGAGRNAIWLARRGFDVTLVDVSDVALDKAEQRAQRLGVANRLRLLRLDLEAPLSVAPIFDLVLVVHYLDRERRDSFVELLGSEGLVVCANPTVTNLERHERPTKRYLVERGELEAWARGLGLDVLVSREAWTDDGMHEAVMIARKRPAQQIGEDIPPERAPSDGPYR